MIWGGRIATGEEKKVLTYTLHRLKLNELISDRKTVTPRYTIIQFLTLFSLSTGGAALPAVMGGHTDVCLS